MQRFDVVVIGGGIVGLATALAVARGRPGTRIAVLEKEPEVGRHQSGRNSGVIHSGVYYRPGSLKARLCVEGAAAMLEFCRAHALPHAVCGKVIVATRDDELPRLEELHRRGLANGVPGLAILGPERLREIEPHAAGLRALHVPATAVTDYRAVTGAMARLIREGGGTVRTGVRVTGLVRRDG
ncbi:MAG TPA: FAD-dependent oxidoreductase, partial [Methylomirabilota bacterium]|nr:FAD-dependent oxidoreductase [Methylomirabilota bacterium]